MEKPLLLTLVVRFGKNAGLKAPLDIGRILEHTGEIENAVFYTEKGMDFPIYIEMIDVVQKAVKANRKIIVQYPLQPCDYHGKQKESIELLKKLDPDNTFILLHDINQIRYSDVEIYKKEMEWLGRFHFFIVHNRKMETYLKQNIENCTCIQLEMFDYLCNAPGKMTDYETDSNNVPQVVFAGSLSLEKAPFLYHLQEDKMRFYLHLYGKRVDKIVNSKIRYGGSAEAEALPDSFIGNLGLIWDGQVDALTDKSSQRQYNKINTPHKFSCYMAAGLPVVAWRDAAIAEVIDKYQVGYLIEDLYEINDLDLSRYRKYKENVKELQNKVRSGYFTLKMWEEAKKIWK